MISSDTRLSHDRSVSAKWKMTLRSSARSTDPLILVLLQGRLGATRIIGAHVDDRIAICRLPA